MDIGNRLYRAEQVRELDRLAIEAHGIAGYELMVRAGEAAFAALRQRWPEAERISICCGGGNNAGDGYVIARLALLAGLSVQVLAVKPPQSLRGDAARAARDWLAVCGSISEGDQALDGDVIVDALLGTGLDRPPEGRFAALIERINQAGKPVLAVDVPSGLNANTGMPVGSAVRAHLTVTFIGNKRGLHTAQAGRWCGQLLYADLGVPEAVHAVVQADAVLLDRDELQAVLLPRPADLHKGELGHVLVVGGDAGMAGAPLLAGMAALRTGSGLVSLATRAAHALSLVSVQPELMIHAVESIEKLAARLEQADVIALGPGLGRSDWSRAMFDRVLEADKPVVIDADGLNLLAASERSVPGCILTPHPGEAARLLHGTVAEVQADRFAAARALADRFDAVVVLKGHGTLVAEPQGLVQVCPYGNPAMASAGMGDALTGIIASLLGQGFSPGDAARFGVLAHALAGDRAAQGRRQILATDLIQHLAAVLPR